jgi:regulator of protease activity HflC (stomatin/prohibitin superfamily)
VRNVVGRFSLDQLLSDSASINDQIKNVIDQAARPHPCNITKAYLTERNSRTTVSKSQL